MIEKTRACTVAFMKTRNSLVVRCREKRVNWEKKQKVVETDGGDSLFFEALSNRFYLKFCFEKFFMVQKCCSWPTFYQLDLMKR